MRVDAKMNLGGLGLWVLAAVLATAVVAGEQWLCSPAVGSEGRAEDDAAAGSPEGEGAGSTHPSGEADEIQWLEVEDFASPEP